MPSNESLQTPHPEEPDGQSTQERQRKKGSKSVTEARAKAQRAKLDAQAGARQPSATKPAAAKPRGSKPTQQRLQANRRANTTITRAMEDYLLDHEGGNHSPKTLEWHRTALGQMRTYMEKERRIALGQNCQRNLFYYLDRHRPGEEELAEWGSAGEDRLFLSETRTPLTKNGVTLLFARLKKRAGITDKRISPYILRHTFAIRYLKLGNDPFSLQELLGHEDMATVKLYMRMNDDDIQEQKRKYSPGDHLPTRMPGPRQARRTGFQAKKRTNRPS